MLNFQGAQVLLVPLLYFHPAVAAMMRAAPFSTHYSWMRIGESVWPGLKHLCFYLPQTKRTLDIRLYQRLFLLFYLTYNLSPLQCAAAVSQGCGTAAFYVYWFRRFCHAPRRQGYCRPSLVRLSQCCDAAACRAGAHQSIPPHDYGRPVFEVAYRPRCLCARTYHSPGLRKCVDRSAELVRVFAAHLNSLLRRVCACNTVYSVFKLQEWNYVLSYTSRKNRWNRGGLAQTIFKIFF